MMKLLSAFLGVAALVAAPVAALTAPGDGTFNGTAKCLGYGDQTCGRFNGTLEAGNGYPIFFGYAFEVRKNATYDPCEAFTAACKGRLSGAIPLIHFGCQPIINETSIAAAFCTEYRNHGGTWDVSGYIGGLANLSEVSRRAPNSDCPQLQPNWCALPSSSEKPVAQP